MSLDFNRHPQLVGQIDVYPTTDAGLPHDLDVKSRARLMEHLGDDKKYQLYFRYKHPHPDAPVVEGHIENVVPGADYYGGVEFWDQWLGAQAIDACIGRITLDVNGKPVTKEGLDLSLKTSDSVHNARLAVAAALGYTPGLSTMQETEL